MNWSLIACLINGEPVLVSLPDIVCKCFIFQIVEMCLKYITHDPNYNYDDYEDDDGIMDTDEDDDGDEDDEYSDDDDMSWKVCKL